MFWVIVGLLWVVGLLFFYCIFTVAKRSDEWREAQFADEFLEVRHDLFDRISHKHKTIVTAMRQPN